MPWLSAALARHCNTLQHTATHCNTLHHTATHSNTLHHTAPHRTTLQHTIRRALQHTATHCNTPHHTAPHRNTLQHTIRRGASASPQCSVHQTFLCPFLCLRAGARGAHHRERDLLFKYNKTRDDNQKKREKISGARDLYKNLDII